MSEVKRKTRLSHRLEYAVVIVIFSALALLPFRMRRKLMGTIMARIIAPLVGYRKRIRKNLEHVWPELDPSEKSRLSIEAARHFGQSICELTSPDDLLALAHQTKLTGPGLASLEQAHNEGRPAIVVSGHFGNYDIVRAALIAHGFEVGALYRRMNNPLFHNFYIEKISKIGTPLFERGRPGLGDMVRHLKGGGFLAALFDVRPRKGPRLPFFGQPAMTATSMAELALRYNAILVPFFGTRLPNDAGFTAEIEAPIPPSDPETMTNALNKALEARIEQNPEQWFWVHNRWKHGVRQSDPAL